MVTLCHWFNCSSHEKKHPAPLWMPTAVHCAILWSISATCSNVRCLGFFSFFTLLPVLPWQQLGNAHFRANGQLLVSYQGEVCGDVLSIDKERMIVSTDFQKGSRMQIQQLAQTVYSLDVFVAERGRWCMTALFSVFQNAREDGWASGMALVGSSQ